jgi:hypothetical protein
VVNIKLQKLEQNNPANINKLKGKISAGCQWLTPVILATQEAGIRKISVQSQPRHIVREILS